MVALQAVTVVYLHLAASQWVVEVDLEGVFHLVVELHLEGVFHLAVVVHLVV
jgi:hypothetical protein